MMSLRSKKPQGLHLGSLATEWGVSLKTIRRDIKLLSEVVGETFNRQELTDENQPGRTWIHYYQDRRKRLFR